MIELALSALSLLAYIWLVSRAYGQAACFRPLPVGMPVAEQEFAVIIPVRNEERRIATCLRALLAQRSLGVPMQIIVVDDASCDHTAEIVRTFGPQGVTLLRAPDLPAGWTGKAHACWIGAQVADRRIRTLVFMDADVCAEPFLMASALAWSETQGTSLLSVMPRLVLGSLAERLVIPCGLFILAFLQDLQQVEHGDDARATGQFMMFDRADYEAIGGHAAVRSEICEDLALARLARRAGQRVEMRDGARLASVRMYDGWRDLRIGLSKNVVQTLGGTRRAIRLAIAALVLAWLPIALAAMQSRDCLAAGGRACGAAALADGALMLAIGFHIAGALHFGLPFAYGVLYPIGYSLCAGLTFDGIRRTRIGALEWKGRTYSSER